MRSSSLPISKVLSMTIWGMAGSPSPSGLSPFFLLQTRHRSATNVTPNAGSATRSSSQGTRFKSTASTRRPFKVMRIQTDNGAEFQAGVHWHLLDKGLQHVYIRPSTTRLNGTVERAHRID